MRFAAGELSANVWGLLYACVTLPRAQGEQWRVIRISKNPRPVLRNYADDGTADAVPENFSTAPTDEL